MSKPKKTPRPIACRGTRCPHRPDEAPSYFDTVVGQRCAGCGTDIGEENFDDDLCIDCGPTVAGHDPPLCIDCRLG